MNNPRAKDNLKPFKSGFDERRNLEGRPPELPELRVMMAEGLTMDIIKSVIKAQADRAISGDTRAAEWLFDRGWGKPNQSTDINLKADITTPMFIFKDISGNEVK